MVLKGSAEIVVHIVVCFAVIECQEYEQGRGKAGAVCVHTHEY